MPTDPKAGRAAVARLAGEPHRRYNPLKDEWVLVSAGRTRRPWLGAQEPDARARGHDLRPGLLSVPGQRPGERQRQSATTTRRSSSPTISRRFVRTPRSSRSTTACCGPRASEASCRVVCFSPRHDLTLGRMEADAVRRVIDVWAEQTAELGAEYRWVQVFENRGEAMGASNPHPHGQIWAGTALPGDGAREDASQRAHLAVDRAAAAARLRRPESGGQRVIVETDEWLTVVPFWAAWPFETLLDPEAPGRAADRSRRCRPRRSRDVAPRAHRAIRRAVQAAVPVFDGLAPGAVRRRTRPTTGRSTPTSTRRCSAPTSASSWSATSCWPRPSATSPPRMRPVDCGRCSLAGSPVGRLRDRRLDRDGPRRASDPVGPVAPGLAVPPARLGRRGPSVPSAAIVAAIRQRPATSLMLDFGPFR